MTFDHQKLLPFIADLYGPDQKEISKQLRRYSRLDQVFSQKFGSRQRHYFSTPGRTEIGGNHTDHNHGRVLAASINLDSIAVASPSSGRVVRLYSQGYDRPFIVDLDDLKVQADEQATTSALIRGIAFRLQELGYTIGGFDACMTSDVLPGSGLSSSASVEVLIGSIFNALFNRNKINPLILARVGQFAENKYFGKPCGLMDQMACAIGGIIAIDFKNPAKTSVRKIKFNFNSSKYSLVVVNTGGNHVDLTPDYAAIPAEMKFVAAALGAMTMRDVEKKNFFSMIPELRQKTGDRAVLRALHFLQDNDRVNKQVLALQAGDFADFLRLINESGNSSYKWLQNIYATHDAREQGVALALALTEKYIREINAGACRIHGGGFAGTILVFLPDSAVKNYTRLMEPVFGKKSILPLRIRDKGSVNLS